MDNTTAIIELAKENALLRRCLADIALSLMSKNKITVLSYPLIEESGCIFREINKLKGYDIPELGNSKT
ncbi:hypothetical protein HZQ94_14955 [Elizabethkingia anophelis]|nr:hypothetical protein [Elizabethkingia anophelis]MCT3682034.1 hypothetical protein [Elizabethkingia anophelis]